MRDRRALATIAALLAVYTVVAIVVAAGVTRDPDGRLLGDPTSDAAGVARGLWVAHAEHENPFTLTRDRYAGAPEGVPASPAINLIEPAQPASVWILSSLFGRVAGINLFALLGIIATALGASLAAMYLLRVGPVAAGVAGFATAFNPWMVEQALAGHLAFLMLWPLIGLIAAIALLDAHRSAWSAALVGLTYGAAFLTAAYLGLLATAVAAAGAMIAITRSRGLADRLWLATLASVASFVVVVLLAPGLIAYALHHSTTARIAAHGAAGGEAVGVWPQQYLNPAPRLAILGFLHVGTRSLAFGSVESVVFLGYSTLALALCTVVLSFRGRLAHRSPVRASVVRVCIGAGVLAVVLSMPPHLPLGGVRLPLPSDLLAHMTTYYRVYSRFGAVVIICAALLASITVDAAWNRRRWAGAALAIAVVVELWPGTLPTWATTSRSIDQWLRSQPKGIVAVFPQPTDSPVAARLALRELALQPNNGDPSYTLLSGGTGGTREAAIRILTRYLTDPLTPGLLAAEHVRYVVVYRDAFAAEDMPAPVPSSSEFAPMYRSGATEVFELKSTVQPADVDATLEQNAASIAAVEGLEAPSANYQGFGPNDSSGWRTFATGATIELHASDASLRRVQLVVHLKAREAAPIRISALDGGVPVTTVTVPPQDTQLNLGPFSMSAGRLTIRLQVSPEGAHAALGSVLIQPLADFSVSLAR